MTNGTKFSNLKYFMQQLAGKIEDIENEEVRNNVQKEFDNAESIIDDIESDLNDIQYTMGNLIK